MAALDEALAALEAMSSAKLQDEWRRLYKTEPPRLPTDLMRRALGYRLQEMSLRGGASAVHRALHRIAAGKPSASPRLKVGTQLMRSWNGRSIAVLVTEDGFSFEGRPYRSLSAIANAVTGTNWSGPRFFGLTGGGQNG
jgi:hypothetical protein